MELTCNRSDNASRLLRQQFASGLMALLSMATGSAAFAQGAPPPGAGTPPPGAPAPVPEVDRSKDCDGACLRRYADKYLAALAAHDPSPLEVTPTLRVAENVHAVALGDNVWKTVVKIRPEKVYFTDPFAGQVLVIGTLEMWSEEPFIYTIRLKLEKGKLSESETMLTSDKIAGQHFRPDLMSAVAPRLDGVVPQNQRMTRDALLKSARVIWGIEPGTPPPSSKTCLHYENWESPFEGSPCRGGTGRSSPRNFRTPLVDVEKGVVVNYQLQDQADPQPRDPPPGEKNSKTPIFYYRPLTFNVMQIARVADGQVQADAMFMNLQEFNIAGVFRR